MKDIATVLIMGGGVMGSGIAAALAAAGKKVLLSDLNDELLRKAQDRVESAADAMEQEGIFSPAQAALAKSEVAYLGPEDLETRAGEADLALESASENHAVKESIFKNLDRLCREDCILASNTSASNIFEYITIRHPENLLIMHWFNPPYLMRLVEVVRGPATSDETVERVSALAAAAGKKPVVLNQYIPGFIVNRIANAICREAGYMIMQGYTTAEDIDTAIETISGSRYAFEGPLRLNDVVGWDLILTGCHDVYASLCNDADTSRYAEALVAAGKLGLKTGEGVYNYSDTDAGTYLKDRAEKIIKMTKVIEDL